MSPSAARGEEFLRYSQLSTPELAGEVEGTDNIRRLGIVLRVLEERADDPQSVSLSKETESKRNRLALDVLTRVVLLNHRGIPLSADEVALEASFHAEDDPTIIAEAERREGMFKEDK